MKYRVYVFRGDEISYINEYASLDKALELVNSVNERNDPRELWAMWKCNFERRKSNATV